MTRGRWPRWLDVLSFLLLLAFAALLRWNWDYRSASVDEASTLFNGWLLLQGQSIYTMTYQPTWPYLSMLPLSLVDVWGGLTAARALSTLWGVLSVALATLIGRSAFGTSAGILAGSILAVYAPAIHLSTFASYDSWAVFLLCLALYLWTTATVHGRAGLLPLGSLVMVGAVLANYVLLSVAAGALVYLTLTGSIAQMRHGRTSDDAWPHPVRWKWLLSLWLPFLLLIGYGWYYRAELSQLWQAHGLTSRPPQLFIPWDFFRQLRDYLWAPFLAALLAFDCSGRRRFAGWLWLLAFILIAHQWYSQDATRLVPQTVYIMVSLAILAGGGLVTLTHGWETKVARRATLAIALALSVALIGYLGLEGQKVLSGLRSYWPETSQLMAFLRDRVRDGDVILMEEGAVGRYYLIAHGRPGHVPAQVWDTWYYQDETGSGSDAALYARAIMQQRFDYIIFDYHVTKELDQTVLPVLRRNYRLIATFPTQTGRSQPIEVFEKIKQP
ncbi:MAG: glycosyltransferase family 39 protein [Anaerolineae bacterium]|nr:glycosyltransferase family 39 protein [Anaerolineae bacterium]